jgi:hypothetical protein
LAQGGSAVVLGLSVQQIKNFLKLFRCNLERKGNERPEMISHGEQSKRAKTEKKNHRLKRKKETYEDKISEDNNELPILRMCVGQPGYRNGARHVRRRFGSSGPTNHRGRVAGNQAGGQLR